MFGFEPSDEQKTLVESVRRFAARELRPLAHDSDERGELPGALLESAAPLALLPASLPEAYGGFGQRSAVTGALFAEELARGSLSLAAAAAMQSLMGTYFIYKYGSEELRRRYLVPALRGETVATFALTEPNAGSDVAGITTRAEKRVR